MFYTINYKTTWMIDILIIHMFMIVTRESWLADWPWIFKVILLDIITTFLLFLSIDIEF